MAEPSANGTTTLSIHVSERTRVRLGWNASNADMTFDEYVRRLLDRDADRARKPFTPEERAERQAALEAAVERQRNRTPEEIEAARQRIYARSPSPLQLPEGKTAEDALREIRAAYPDEPDDETDEDIEDQLRRLS